jgi:hypothetical protein
MRLGARGMIPDYDAAQGELQLIIATVLFLGMAVLTFLFYKAN